MPCSHHLSSICLAGLLQALPSAALCAQGLADGEAADRTAKVVFLAGRGSHAQGQHEHVAGCELLAEALGAGMPGVEAVVCRGWPEDASVLEAADVVVIYCDGGGGHLALPHLEALGGVLDRGAGLVCLHYAVVVPKERAGRRFLDWMGGYYETWWSVNPVWTATFEELPDHPVARGVEPFTLKDEWYYHMRFRDGMDGVTPILTAVPPDATRRRPDGPHSNNEHVRARMGMPEHVAWAYERPGGGRGFGFTGGHWHANWRVPNVQRLVLNAIVWAAGVEVPEGGVP